MEDQRFDRACELWVRLADQGIWFAPIRHHSPACARAVAALITEIRPKAVLIEGPSEYDRLLPVLADPATQPPIAILSLRPTQQGPVSTFFPLADFSPEWVALRTAAATSTPVAFIDHPWAAATEDPEDDQVRGLAAERYYAQSQALAALAQQEHCRDHDELWEHLFELRSSNWRTLFPDVFAWSALARQDYEPEVLQSEGSVPREAVMTSHILSWREKVAGPLVVVTGAFHTLALVEALAVRLLAQDIPEAQPVLSQLPSQGPRGQAGSGQADAASPANAHGVRPGLGKTENSAWLIRYDLTRLDALTGYGAGIRSPGFYQRQWDTSDATDECPEPGTTLDQPGGEARAQRSRARRGGHPPTGGSLIPRPAVVSESEDGWGGPAEAGPDRANEVQPPIKQSESNQPPAPYRTRTQDLTAAILTDIATQANKADTTDQLSVAEVIEATLQAHRLADLRGHPYPGRADLLDACASCFSRGDLPPAIRDAIAEVFGGTRLGTVPPDNPAPPIIAEARTAAARLRLVINDSAKRTTTLDVRRSASARARSRFFWLTSYLDSGFAQRLAGPDYIAGVGLGRLREEWEYAWTPLVEARLIALIDSGATLHEAARARLRTTEAAADPRSSQAVAALVAQAAVIGLDDELARLWIRLDQLIEQDGRLDSVFGAVRQVLAIWRARELLDLSQPDDLLSLVKRALPQLAYLLEKGGKASAEDEPMVIQSLIGAQDLIRTLAESPQDPLVPADDTVVLRSALSRLRIQAEAPGVLGAALALGVTAGEVSDEELGERVRAMFAPGADSERALRFFDGVMQAAPDLFLHTPELFNAVERAVVCLEPTAFLELLPDLRRCFSRLRPIEVANLAQTIAERTGLDPSALATAHVSLDASDLRMGTAVEQALLASLAQDQLLTLVAVLNHDKRGE